VVTAADGPHALILAQTGTFDVIVLDVILPGCPVSRSCGNRAPSGSPPRFC
jgi:CheY-like chemotaxis protein